MAPAVGFGGVPPILRSENTVLSWEIKRTQLVLERTPSPLFADTFADSAPVCDHLEFPADTQSDFQQPGKEILRCCNN